MMDDSPRADESTEEIDELIDLFGALLAHSDDTESKTADEAKNRESEQSGLASTGQRSLFGPARPPVFDLALRTYQDEAIYAWARHDGRVLIVLPTGTRKTVVALAISARLGLRTLVVVPTIDLLTQLRLALADRLGYPFSEVGVDGGGKRTFRDLTVITYDSAAMPYRDLSEFGLQVVDEVHHLPARAYRAIAGKVNAPFRPGLSATPERTDFGQLSLDQLIGPIVYRRSRTELAGDADAKPSILDVLDDKPARRQGLSNDRLETAFPGRSDLESAVAPPIACEIHYVHGFGLCGRELIDELRRPLSGGPIDIADDRRLVLERVSDVPGVDALMSHLLTNGLIVVSEDPDAHDRKAR